VEGNSGGVSKRSKKGRKRIVSLSWFGGLFRDGGVVNWKSGGRRGGVFVDLLLEGGVFPMVVLVFGLVLRSRFLAGMMDFLVRGRCSDGGMVGWCVCALLLLRGSNGIFINIFMLGFS